MIIKALFKTLQKKITSEGIAMTKIIGKFSRIKLTRISLKSKIWRKSMN